MNRNMRTVSVYWPVQLITEIESLCVEEDRSFSNQSARLLTRALGTDGTNQKQTKNCNINLNKGD